MGYARYRGGGQSGSAPSDAQSDCHWLSVAQPLPYVFKCHIVLRCCALVLPPFSLAMATLDASQVVPGAAFDTLVELVHGLQLPPVEAFHVAEAVVPLLEMVVNHYADAHKTVLHGIASMRSGWSCLASAASFAPSQAVQQSSRGASLPAAASSPDADLDVAALRSQIEHDNHVIAELQIQNENAKQQIELLQQQVQELSAECQARIEGARNENEKLQLQVSELQALLSRGASAPAPAIAPAPALAMGGLSVSALLQRVGDGNKAQQFAALLRDRLPGRSYRLLYTWSRDGRSAASFHQRCDNQVRAHAFARAAAARLTVGAGSLARHRAFHHRPHVRRLRKRAVGGQCRQLHQSCGLLPVPGRKSSRRRPHLL